MNNIQKSIIKDTGANYINGWFALMIWLGLMGVILWDGFVTKGESEFVFWEIGILLLLIIFLKGFLIISPNLAAVLTFFGNYSGTIFESGFFWYNPLATSSLISLRINNFTTETIKVNDKNGNPIEIAAVISWRVADTAKAAFAVSDYTSYVGIACESAIREVASSRAYDHSLDENEQLKTLRGDLVGVAQDLEERIDSHVGMAGIEINSARITHLAYAPEVAMSMLRKQQATAIVAARQLIVDGAVGMVKQAINEIEQADIVKLSNDQRAALVTNLLTVLVSESETQPVITLNKS